MFAWVNIYSGICVPKIFSKSYFVIYVQSNECAKA